MSRSRVSSRAGDQPSLRGAWMPRVFFWGLIAALLFLVWCEVENRLGSPSVVQRWNENRTVELSFYSRGRADRREIWVFKEAADGSGSPRLLVRLDRASSNPEAVFHWSLDGRGLLLFDSTASTAAPRFFPFGKLPPSPDPGPVAARMGELGAREPRLRFWQATRWERALKAAD